MRWEFFRRRARRTAMAQMALAVSESADAGAYHYFSAHGCVFVDSSQRSVFIGGTLVGSYDVSDKSTRNAILVKLSEDPKVHLGKLAEAFELGREQLRNLQKKYTAGGLSGAMEIKQGGCERVVTPALRQKLYELFDAAASINTARAKVKACISRTIVSRTRKAWRLEREREAGGGVAAEATVEPVQIVAPLELARPPSTGRIQWTNRDPSPSLTRARRRRAARLGCSAARLCTMQRRSRFGGRRRYQREARLGEAHRPALAEP